MLKFHPYSILTGDTGVEFVIYSVYYLVRSTELCKLCQCGLISQGISISSYPQKNVQNRCSLNFQIKLVSKGINELIKSQLSEGKNLIQDISKKLLVIEKIKKRIVKRTGRYRSGLEKKYSDEIIQNVANIDLLDIKKDINNALDKVDIEEEIIRLDSHIFELNKVLKKKGSKGLRIDFYMQEINREANTISSKSKDPRLSECAIEIKTYLNQIREIAANIA